LQNQRTRKGMHLNSIPAIDLFAQKKKGYDSLIVSSVKIICFNYLIVLLLYQYFSTHNRYAAIHEIYGSMAVLKTPYIT